MHALPSLSPPVLAAVALALLGASSTRAAEPLTVVAVQYPIEGSQDAPAIAKKVGGYVEKAKSSGADVVVFPELLTFDAWPLGDERGDKAITRWIARVITPAYFSAVKELAKEHQVAIVGGSSPRLDDGKVFNTALVAFPDGRAVTQDKINLTYWEEASGWSGGEELRPFDAPWGRSVVLICYDAEFPTLSTALLEARPLVWFVPSMTDTVHGLERVRWSAQARAVEHHAFVVVTGTVGQPSNDFPNVGQAAFLTPRRAPFDTEVTEGARDEAGLVRAVLDVGKLRASRKGAKLYPAKDAADGRSPPRVKLLPARSPR